MSATPRKLFADVILPVPVPKAYTYAVPESMEQLVAIGGRVVVQFGRKKLYSAVVVKLHPNSPVEYETKDIVSVLDTSPIITSQQLMLWEWISSYYMAFPGDVMKAALPAGMKLESETRIFLTDENADHFDLDEQDYKVVQLIEERKSTTVQDLCKELEVKNPMAVLGRLLQLQIIRVEESLKESIKPRTESVVALHPSVCNEAAVNQLFEKLTSAPAQQRLLLAYLSLSQPFDWSNPIRVKQKDLLEKVQVTYGVLKACREKEIFVIEQREISRIEDGEATNCASELSDAQQKALAEVEAHFKEKDVVLLHGVTGSGKTEIYIQLIQKALDEEKQVLYLLPEIALTTQIINRLSRVFGDRVGIYHSKFSDAQRTEVYTRMLGQGVDANNSRYDLILGVRSSVFLPYSNLGLVIVDEEHENTYKQYDPSPRYHARDTAMVMANLFGAKVLLGTATPSIESYQNALQGKYGLVELLTRHKDVALPNSILANTIRARKMKQMVAMFTPQMVKAMDEALLKKEQIILFQNRRGFSPYLECSDCAHIPRCENCDVSLTYHKAGHNLVCHYCGFTTKVPARCPACHSTDIQTRGFGTEKIEEELQVVFPEARIARMDLDTTRSRSSYEQLISDFEEHKLDVLVGTQMVTKGLDFDKVSVVGVLDADNPLNFPDFRAHERSFQLMAQVSGRAGRKEKQGLVVIQTAQPEHPVLKFIVDNNYIDFFKSELQQRQQFMYPPFYRLIRITIKHRDRAITNAAAEMLVALLKQAFGKRVLGPEEPIVSRIQTFYIKNILLKVERDRSVARAKEILAECIVKVKGQDDYRSVFFSPDVDPY
jgi:primosomal protein N' (replication factor Y)